MLVSGVMVNAAYLRRQPDASRARAGRHRRYRSPQSVSSRPMTDSNKMTATDTIAVTLNVNGEQHALVIAPQRTLLDCLRYDLGLTGSKEGCGVGVGVGSDAFADGVLDDGVAGLPAPADDSRGRTPLLTMLA